MTTINTTITNAIALSDGSYPGGAYLSPLTITSTGYIDAGTNGIDNAAVVALGTTSLYLLNQGRIRATGAVYGVLDVTGLSINNTGTISSVIDAVYLVHGDTITNGGTIIATSGFGVYANTGASQQITNTATGLISGYVFGVHAQTATISNSGTIRATGTGGRAVVLTGNAGSIYNSGLITAAKQGVYFGGAGTVNDIGTISGSYGVVLKAGGFVSNGGTGVISGTGHAAVQIGGGAGTVMNRATISGSSGPGIALSAGGYVSNSGSGVISGSGSGNPGLLAGGAALTVVNAGIISGATGIAPGNFANTVTDSGTIIGISGVAIQFGSANDLLKFTPSANVHIQGTVDGGAGTNTLEFTSTETKGTLTGDGADFVNFTKGTIDSLAYWVFAGANTIGAGTTLTDSGTLVDTGTLTNAGTITGSGKFIVDPTTFTNTGYMGIAVTLAGTGDVLDNSSTGTIKVTGNAVVANGSAATVNNLGTIQGTGNPSYGVVLNAGGTVTNGASTATNAFLYGLSDGIIANNTTATVINYGTISGPGVGGVAAVNLTRGGNVINAPGASLLSNFVGVQVGKSATSASVTNSTSAQISGGYGLRGAIDTLANAGTITATNKAGIDLYHSASIGNAAGALIAGGTYGISINTGALTLTNDGVITGKNYALGLSVTASNTVTNFGTIKSTLQSAFGSAAAAPWRRRRRSSTAVRSSPAAAPRSASAPATMS